MNYEIWYIQRFWPSENIRIIKVEPEVDSVIRDVSGCLVENWDDVITTPPMIPPSNIKFGMAVQTDMPVTTAGQNRNKKYNLNIWRPICFSKTGSSYNWGVNWDIFMIFGTLRDVERLRRLALSNWKLEADMLR